MANISKVISTVISALSTVFIATLEDVERLQLVSAIDQLRAASETPHEKSMKLGFALGTFFLLSLESLTENIRVVRFLCAYNFSKDTGQKTPTYKATPLAFALANGTPARDTLKHLHNFLPVSAKLHAYFEQAEYRNSDEADHGTWQVALDTKDHYSEWLGKSPEAETALHTAMKSARGIPQNWFEIYPVTERLDSTPYSSSDPPARALTVDIGGNQGHELAAFRAHFPDLQGRLVPEDLPSVINSISILDESIERSLQALKNVREEMALDSVLLLYDLAYPDKYIPGNTIPATLDWMMMECFSALIRTQKEWVELLVQAGLRVKKVWKPDTKTPLSLFLFEAVIDDST
ncbi:hypothetical protein BJY04DRAFT_218525 [Aspergillus karnatakaensis]|uniref:uncharacterized protein n=1 Tax=Aspergillus karnatakaensis TaxID=1810916 RepID=UPI003CCD5FFE